MIDQAALTGESLPVSKQVGAEVFSGSTVKQGHMICLVTKTGSNTFFGKTAKLVESAGNVSHFQQSVLSIGKFLIIGSLILAVFIIANGLYKHEAPLELLEMVLILMVASIPVAMPAVLSVTMALGALKLSKKKAIVSNLSAIEEMAAVDILCSDKTGTLTKNELTLGDPILYKAKDADELNLIAALASNRTTTEAIDSTVISYADEKELDTYTQVEFSPFDPIGKRTRGRISRGDEDFAVIKGAPKVIVEKCIDSDEIKQKALQEVDDLAQRGLRALGVAKSIEGDRHSYELYGILSLFDPPRDDSKKTIEDAIEHGIAVKMVTGDDLAIGKEISGQLGLGTNMQAASETFKEGHSEIQIEQEIEKADGFARVFPEHKYQIVKTYQKMGHVTAMTGDGVNDAPALKQADVGIAVSGATDAARGAADLILTLPGLSVIIDAVEESRRIFQKIISYVKYRVAMTINIMLFVTLSIIITGFEPLSAVMIVMLALLDDLPIMTIAYDNALPEEKPVKWDLTRVLTVATVLGIVSVGTNFGLMHIAESFYSETTAFGEAHIQSMLFLHLVIAGHFLLFTVRNKKWMLSSPRPNHVLLTAIFGTQIIAVIIVKFTPLVANLTWEQIGIVFAYDIVWVFVINIIKMAVEKSFDMRIPKDETDAFNLINKKVN